MPMHRDTGVPHAVRSSPGASAVAGCVGAGLVLMAAGMPGAAQERYPSRPVTIVVPYAAGGGVDPVARLVARKLEERLKQPVVVLNRAGAAGMIGSSQVARAKPDGYTLLWAGTALPVYPSIFKTVPFDPMNDFAPISLIAKAPFVMVVHPGVPADSLAAFKAYAKSRPSGSLNYSSVGQGTVNHLFAELVQTTMGLKLVHVPYGGGAPAMLSTISNETQMSVASVVPVLPHVREGRLRAIGIAASRRSPLLPDVPTFREQGVDLESGLWHGLAAPKGTPAEVVARLNGEVRALLRDEEVARLLVAEGAEPVGTSPEEFAGMLKGAVSSWRRIAETAGIFPE